MRTAIGLVLATIVAGCTIDPVTFTPATVPVLRAPMNDAYVGLPSVERSLRPAFVWAPSTGSDGITYELQLSPDRSFTSMVTSVTTEATTFQPAQDLAIATTPPVGTRYHWRVRACLDGACSAFSPARWVNVGRSDHDVNGDGYADVVIGAPGVGRAFLYFGQAGTFEPTPDGTLAGATPRDAFGASVAMAGDVNGDGFADIVIGAPYAGVVTENAGRAYVFLGGAGATFDTRVDGVLEGVRFEHIGRSVSAAGDVNGDGYADIVVGGDRARARVYLGGAGTTFDNTVDGELTQAAPEGYTQVASAGDVDGDGFADVLIGAPTLATPGQVFLYRGGAGATFDPTVDQTLTVAHGSFGTSVAGLGDVNGDGFADVAIGAPDAGVNGQGNASVFYGGTDQLHLRPGGSLTGSAPSEALGSIVAAAGDVNADGFADLLVGGRWGRGARVYYGRSGLDFETVADGELAAPGALSITMRAAGDVNGDGYADVVEGAPDHPTESFAPQEPGVAAIFLGGPGSVFEPTADATLRGAELDDLFGSSVAAMESTRAHPIYQSGRRLPAPECALVPEGLTWKQPLSIVGV